jgi:hypothetical protein
MPNWLAAVGNIALIAAPIFAAAPPPSPPWVTSHQSPLQSSPPLGF